MEAAVLALAAFGGIFLVRKMLLDFGLLGGRDCGCGKCGETAGKDHR